MRTTLEGYFRSWIDTDLDTVKEIFSEDVVYTV